MDWPRAIIHLDMDTFFVSVERKFDPSLIGRPVIVGGGSDGDLRRGVVAACSYEARTFGVHSAMPLAQAMRLCPQAKVIPVGRSNYGAETAKVRTVLDQFTDLYEMTSPDEAYIDLTGTRQLHGTPIKAAHDLRMRIHERVGLPVSVGLATTKSGAKIASKLSKPRGLFVIFPGGEEAILRPLSLSALPGLGPKTAEMLHQRGMHTLGDLVKYGESALLNLLGDYGVSLHRRARGIGSSEVCPDRQRVQVSTENTFREDIGDVKELHAELARMSMKIGMRLRQMDQWAGNLTLKLRYPFFKTLTRRMSLDAPTRDDTILLKTASRLFDRAWDHKTPIRLLGIGASGLVDSLQPDLFQAEVDQKQERLLKAMDQIRRSEGKEKLIWGAVMERNRGK